VSHNPSHNSSHIIIRNGSFVFNRRVPKADQAGFGSQFVRAHLGRDQDKAEMLASRLTKKLDEIWASPSVQPIDVSHLLMSITPKVITFDFAVDAYLLHRGTGRGAEFQKVVRMGFCWLGGGVLWAGIQDRSLATLVREDSG